MKQTIFIILSLIAPLLAHGEWKKIIHIENDFNDASAEVWMKLSENRDIDLFKYIIDGEEYEEGLFTGEDLRKGEVFKKGLFKKFVKLRSRQFSSRHGGQVILTVPRNIFLGKKIKLTYHLERQGDNWEVNQDHYFNIKEVNVHIRKSGGVPVGIQTIVPIRYSEGIFPLVD